MVALLHLPLLSYLMILGTNGNVTFSIEATNSSNGRLSLSEDEITDGSFVTIDTVSPP